MMGQFLLPGDPPIEISLRRSGRARRLSLRVSRMDGRVTLSLPRWTPEAEGLDFLRSREDWLRRLIGARAEAVTVGIGTLLPVEGRMMRVAAARIRGVQAGAGAILVPDDPARAGARVGAWLRVRARDRLAAACDRHAAALGTGYRTLVLRDTRSRWGSCAAEGRLMFSWRLILAPPRVLDYVAAHEVAHRIEMNHSPAFWAVVERLLPRWQAERDWLRLNGQSLHRWRFGDGK